MMKSWELECWPDWSALQPKPIIKQRGTLQPGKNPIDEPKMNNPIWCLRQDAYDPYSTPGLNVYKAVTLTEKSLIILFPGSPQQQVCRKVAHSLGKFRGARQLPADSSSPNNAPEQRKCSWRLPEDQWAAK